MTKYHKEAVKIYEERQQNEIRRIANELKEKDEEKKKQAVYDLCSHTYGVDSRSHGRVGHCSECGMRVQ